MLAATNVLLPDLRPGDVVMMDNLSSHKRAKMRDLTLHLGGQPFVTTAQYFALMRALEELSGDPALGVRMVREVDTAVHPPSSLAAFYARDYRDGLARIARFKRL